MMISIRSIPLIPPQQQGVDRVLGADLRRGQAEGPGDPDALRHRVAALVAVPSAGVMEQLIERDLRQARVDGGNCSTCLTWDFVDVDTDTRKFVIAIFYALDRFLIFLKQTADPANGL